MNLLSLVEFESNDIILEATDIKGAIAYLQNAFEKAGLTITITIKGSGSTIRCSGSLNRAKFAFTITLVNGKLTADFTGMNIDAMISPPSLKIGKDFRSGVQKFIVDSDNAIAEIRAAKTFLMRLTRVLERVTVVAQKNAVPPVKVNESQDDYMFDGLIKALEKLNIKATKKTRNGLPALYISRGDDAFTVTFEKQGDTLFTRTKFKLDSGHVLSHDKPVNLEFPASVADVLNREMKNYAENYGGDNG